MSEYYSKKKLEEFDKTRYYILVIPRKTKEQRLKEEITSMIKAELELEKDKRVR